MELRGQVESSPPAGVAGVAAAVLAVHRRSRGAAPGAAGLELAWLAVAMFLSEAGARPRACEASAAERRKWVEVGVGARPEVGPQHDQGHF